VFLHFLLPDFLPTLRKIGADLLQGLELPALEKLAARGSLSPAPAQNMENWLFGRFGLPADAPTSAPYCLLAEGAEPGQEYWLHADPIHLGLQRTGLAVSDLFELDRNEADALLASLNAHFAADGLEFSAPHPRRWYGKSARPIPPARPQAGARGGPAEHTPVPGDGGRWQRTLSEIQMLLHAHPVNAAREERGALPVNSLWLWGGGTLETPPAQPFAAVLADNLLARGLHTAIGGKPLGLSDALLPGNGETLVVEESLRQPAAYGDFSAWREALSGMEARWFTPLLHALEQNKIAALALHFPDSGLRLDIRRGDLWKIWRRRPLSKLTE
jgi:hypothetical protein